MQTITTSDGYKFTQQLDGTWLGGMGDVYDYPPAEQHFCHIESGGVLLLPPGNFIPCDKLRAFGVLTEAIFIWMLSV